MQPSVIVRRFMLVSGLGELVPTMSNTPLACGLTVRPRANTIIDTVTYLVDETSRRWSWEVFRATVGGHDVESWQPRPGYTFYVPIPGLRSVSYTHLTLPTILLV